MGLISAATLLISDKEAQKYGIGGIGCVCSMKYEVKFLKIL